MKNMEEVKSTELNNKEHNIHYALHYELIFETFTRRVCDDFKL